ncbi:uroporphyrinogen-III synthase [Streptococcus cuniculi]|uniref:Uroporphyrinogen-III synthase n=1 Tax=Streptococcus cuniculi TaxID=1432788 RepID=A0A4Y9JEN2_9STRE|nr:uroporphyrinogen-III synthase [Streptococcus cuniculi]MBF0777628.1 uroporphyrinogen-III synthase [Streptococcus cuniculi]TFU98668.1 uroporphyrinogen-III synthase [Streptococcus cuniculi]
MTKTVIFTREHPLDSRLQSQLEEAGFKVHHLPLIQCQANPMPKEVLDKLSQMDWVFFTSAVAAECLAPYLKEPLPRVATIGHQTSKAVMELGYPVAFESKYQYAKDFAAEWLALNQPKQKILLPQSSLSNPILAEMLREGGQEVLAWALYDTQHHKDGQEKLSAYLTEQEVLWTFASPSAWQSFHEICQILPEAHEIAVIGTSTQQAVEMSGSTVSLMPETPSIEKMVQTIIEEKGKKYDIVY